MNGTTQAVPDLVAARPKRPVGYLGLLQVLLTGCAVTLSWWARMPWLGTLGLAVLGGSAVAASLAPQGRGAIFWKRATACAWVCTLLIPATLLWTPDEGFSFERYLDQYFAVMAWLVTAAILPASLVPAAAAQRARWRLPVLVWAGFGTWVWIGAAYLENQPGAFYLGLVIAMVWLLFGKLWLTLPSLAIQGVNTLLLLLIGLPLADWCFHPAYRLPTRPDVRKRLYSFTAAKSDPAAFAQWWDYYLSEWHRLEKQIVQTDPTHVVPFQLVPSSQAIFGQCPVHINQRGFRGREISPVKGNAYRIVAIGESTTFGVTLDPDDQPWPEQLETLIRQRLHPARPVEVINAGVPGYTVENNLARFARDIRPLQPDLVISYHGVNGFPMFDGEIPHMVGKPPPMHVQRPLRLLADCEYRWKLLAYRRQQTSAPAQRPASAADPMQSRYAQLYRELIELAHTQHFRLALANFSMAVNTQSSPEAIRFYQVGYPFTPRQIRANVLHSTVVQTLWKEFPEVCPINTQTNLDGRYDNFIDLVHLSPEGKRRMAETVYSSLEPLLKQELTSASAPPRP